MEIYRLSAVDLNNTKVFYFDTYENAYQWAIEHNWYFHISIFKVTLEIGKYGAIKEKSVETIFEK